MVSTGSDSTVQRPLHRTPAKNNQAKVPKNIHKSEREKLKRDCLNELFLELDEALEPTEQNSGKACILSSAIKIVRELKLQVESLRKENAALLNEEKYVMMERNELEEETIDLAAEVRKMQDETREKHNPFWQNVSGASIAPVPESTPTSIPIQQTTNVDTVCVIPLPTDLQTDQDKAAEPLQTHQVSRPQARYPSGSDLWPNQILSEQQICQGDGEGGTPRRMLSLF